MSLLGNKKKRSNIIEVLQTHPVSLGAPWVIVQSVGGLGERKELPKGLWLEPHQLIMLQIT